MEGDKFLVPEAIWSFYFSLKIDWDTIQVFYFLTANCVWDAIGLRKSAMERNREIPEIVFWVI